MELDQLMSTVMPQPAVTLTFDLCTPKSNQHIYETKYTCDQDWVKSPSLVFTARRSYASAVLVVVILSICSSVRPSVCLSVTRVLCDKTKQCTADILIPHRKVITLVF